METLVSNGVGLAFFMCFTQYVLIGLVAMFFIVWFVRTR